MARLTTLVLLLVLAAAMAFVPPTPQTSRVVKTRVHSWWGGKKAKEPEAPPAKGKGAAAQKPANKRATAMDYRGTVVEKDQDVIVPATEYFAQKNDPIVPILFAGLFVPVFGLLGWWILSPTPEPEIVNPDQKISYDVYVNSGKAKPRRF